MQDRKEQAKAEVATLVEKFQQLTPAQVHAYNEEDTKKDFILPLFQALGWNVNEKEEVAAEVSASNGRVDYAFKLHGVPRFYVEAKALGNDLTDPKWARQAVTYAYHKGVTWAVLFSFSHLKIFNANLGATDATAGLLMNLSAGDLLVNLDRIWNLSRESVEERALEKEAERQGRLPTRIPVEKRLYGQLRGWRETLFNSTARYEPHLTGPQVDEIIQRLFNRLIFIRTCEDRDLESKELLSALHRYIDKQLPGNPPLLQELRRLFKHYARYYDSDLFDLHLVDTIHIDDPLLEEMFSGLHGVPGGLADYDFSLIDADILGAVYEQYLGHVAQEAVLREKKVQQQLRLGLPGGTTYEITEKRQRRKEQGIYYTPLWVTDYIVRQTVGAFIEEHKNRPDAIHEMKILDMSCGSGSFLIRAYDELLKWEADSAGIPLDRMTQEFRMPLLKNNIFGVDLDPQAIEIARLNLLLRALAQRELLPSLADNIKRGNSLISGTEAELRPYFGDGWEEKRPFNWEEQFPDIMTRGGVDIIIGNPPYVETSLIPREERDYYRKAYKAATGLFDLYVLFMEHGMNVLKSGGRLGFITSGKFLKSEYGKAICNLIEESATVETLVDLSKQKQVFGKEATNYPVILVARKQPSERRFTFVETGETPTIETIGELQDIVAAKAYEVAQTVITQGTWPPPRRAAATLLKKVQANGEALGSLADVYHGLQTNADPVFLLERRSEAKEGKQTVLSHATGTTHEMESALLHPLLKGSVHMRRYYVEDTNLLLLFPYFPSSGNLLPPETMQERYPLAWEYLNAPRCKAILGNREGGKWQGNPKWYGYSYRKNHDKFGTGKPRVGTPSIAARASYSYDKSGEHYLIGSGGGGGGGYGVELHSNISEDYCFVLGLLNSKLLDYYLAYISTPFRGGYKAYSRQYIAKLPIRRIDFSDATDKEQHDALVALVERMLALQERLKPLRGTGLTEEHDLLREVERVDSDIDNLVYDLYGLTEAERRLVEGRPTTAYMRSNS